MRCCVKETTLENGDNCPHNCTLDWYNLSPWAHSIYHGNNHRGCFSWSLFPFSTWELSSRTCRIIQPQATKQSQWNSTNITVHTSQPNTYLQTNLYIYCYVSFWLYMYIIGPVILITSPIKYNIYMYSDLISHLLYIPDLAYYCCNLTNWLELVIIITKISLANFHVWHRRQHVWDKWKFRTDVGMGDQGDGNCIVKFLSQTKQLL